MTKELLITPEELYYLGGYLQAKYIDYAYIAAMDDIGSAYALFERETKASLVASGVLMEDFSGNTEIDPLALDILKPVFFGEVETSLDVCQLGEKPYVDVYKYHHYDGAITLVTGKDGKLLIKAVDSLMVKESVNKLIPEDYSVSTEAAESIDKKKITRLMAVKRSEVGGAATVETYIESDGVIYREADSGIEKVSREDFTESVYDILKGV